MSKWTARLAGALAEGHSLRRALAIPAALALAATCQAGDVGIGVSLKPSDNAIYVPFKVGDRLLLEGSFQHWHSNSDSDTLTGAWQNGRTSSQIGLGVFGVVPLTDTSHLYWGPRVGYLRETQSQSLSGVGSQEFKGHGFSLTPTLGVEYFPIKHVSIGAEVGFSLSRLNGTNSNTGSPDTSFHSSQTQTVSAVIVRYYF